jgi:hypothetical protein
MSRRRYGTLSCPRDVGLSREAGNSRPLERIDPNWPFPCPEARPSPGRAGVAGRFRVGRTGLRRGGAGGEPTVVEAARSRPPSSSVELAATLVVDAVSRGDAWPVERILNGPPMERTLVLAIGAAPEIGFVVDTTGRDRMIVFATRLTRG